MLINEKQMGLFDVCANKHEGNQQSREANPSRESKSYARGLILAFIKSCGKDGATSEEISLALGLPMHRVSGRCSELKSLEQVKVCGTRFNKSGKSAAVLVAR